MRSENCPCCRRTSTATEQEFMALATDIPHPDRELRERKRKRPVRPQQVVDLSSDDEETSVPRVYLEVPFAQKDFVKSHRGLWDSEKRMWYCIGEVPDELQKYVSGRARRYLRVSISERQEAKRMGARFDWDRHLWYFLGEVPTHAANRWPSVD